MPSEWCSAHKSGINIADMILLIWCSDAAGILSEVVAGTSADADANADAGIPYNDLWNTLLSFYNERRRI